MMKYFVTGVNGQLGHDVMNELNKRGHEGVGSDIAGAYADVADGSAVTTMPYVGLDINDKEAVLKVISEIKPDAVIHCAAWTAVDMAEDDDKVERVRAVNAGVHRILLMPVKPSTARCSTCPRTMCSMVRAQSLGSRTAKIISL